MYTDSRPGRKTGPVILDARSISSSIPSPDPLLPAGSGPRAVYHFGLRLSFQRQFRPIQT
jgi:hypothetical protein